MFTNNPNYAITTLGDGVAQEPSIKVEEYPENQLPKIYVDGVYGDIEVVTSDIYDLFSQQRLDNLGADVVRDYLARNLPKTSPVSDVISKMSDDEIINSIRSKNIQQPSELLRWSRLVVQGIDDVLTTTPNSDSSSTTENSNNNDNGGV